MWSIRSANLVFDEPQAAYYAGQVLTGRLELVLDEPLEYSAINLTFLGAAQVAWTEYEGSNNRDGLVSYRGREVYFDVVQCLSGGQGINRLNLGTHNFPFQFQIPLHSPSSFIASSSLKGSAKVAYSIRANVIYGPGKPPGREESQVEKSFQVIAPFDLNKGSEDIKKPIILELEETISCCFSYDPVSVTIHVPHAGFCPGQDIPITITSTNNSTVEIKRMLFQLVQKERYRSTEPVSDMVVPERVLTSVKSGPVLTKMKQEVTRYLKVPDMIAPNLMNCSIVDVGFFLKVKIQLSGCNEPMEDTAEICLGLIPLASSQDSDKYQHPLQSRLPLAAIPEITNVSRPRETAQVNVPMQSRPYTPQSMPHSNAGCQGPSPCTGLPIPGSNAPYPGFNAPITGSNAPDPGSNAPYPGSNAPYPGSNAPIPGSNAPIPGSNLHIPGPNPPYPRSNSPNLVSNPPYPGSTSPYAVSNLPYARSNSPNPGSNPPYPGSNPPNPGSNPPYPGSNPPHPGSNPPYPGSNSGPTPYPADLPYPGPAMPTISPTGPNMPYPGSNPYSANPLKTGTIGFMMPSPNVSYSVGNKAHSPIPPYPKESAPSAPSE